MQAAMLYGPRDLQVVELEEPRIGGEEVLVGVRSVGICSSDVHYYVHGEIANLVVREPLVLGHEFAGEVLEVGKETTGISVGDRVAVDPAITCGACSFCREGRSNLCSSVKFCGTPGTDGALRELVAYKPRLVFPMPSHMSYEEGAMLEPLSIALHACDLGGIQVGQTVVVLGCGPIGLFIMQVAKLSGCGLVIAVDLLPSRLKMAGVLGADGVVDAGRDDPVQQVMSMTDGQGVDLVLEAAGALEAPQQAIAMAKPGGRVILVGIGRKDEIRLKWSTARRKGLTLQFVVRARNTYLRALGLVAKGRIEASSLITHRFPLVEASKAFGLVASSPSDVVKAVIEVGG